MQCSYHGDMIVLTCAAEFSDSECYHNKYLKTENNKRNFFLSVHPSKINTRIFFNRQIDLFHLTVTFLGEN